MRRITYKVTNITVDGAACTAKNGKPIVRFEEISECVAITCIYPDNSIELTIDDSDPNCKQCFRIIIECDGCPSCPPVIKDVCLCGPGNVCPPCFVCIDGKCVPKCPDKACDPEIGDCVDCDDKHPCPCNQLCIQGKCVCPPGKVKDDQGCCVDCLPGDVHPENPCIICEGGKWKAKECIDGKCNPLTGDCDQCINKEDCKDPNQCCEGGKCVCCPGYILDPITKLCIPQPDCGPNKPCGHCEYCEDGKCKPIVCAEGYSPVWNEDKKICECLPTCDCDRPDCQNPEHTCVDRNNDGICNCHDCGNKPCSPDIPCPKGCKCVNGVCVKDNCGNPCENGLNCGKGCGCDETTKICVDCTQNPNALGCKDGCQGDCISREDCGEGCTCFDQECVDCSNFSCNGDECDKRPGCKCVNGKCVGDPEYCQDTFKAEVKPCNIRATLNMKNECACPVITALVFPWYGELVHTTPIPGSYPVPKVSMSFAIRLVKGLGRTWEQAKTLPRLSDTSHPDIAHNEMPTSGTINFTVSSTIRKYVKVGDKWIDNGSTTIEHQNVNATFSNDDEVTLQNILLERVNIRYQTSETEAYEVLEHRFYSQLSSALTFDNNCVYKSVQVIGYSKLRQNFNSIYEFIADGRVKYDNYFYKNQYPGNSDLSGQLNLFKKLTSQSSRHPLFKIYRSIDSVYEASDAIRKLYVQPDYTGVYSDVLYGPKMFDPIFKQNLTVPEGRLLGDMHYLFTNDCSCKEREVDLGKVRFCDPIKPFETSDYEFLNCNRIFNIKNDFLPCVVNQDLKQFIFPGEDDYSLIENHQAEYRLYINGSKVNTFVHKAGLGMVLKGTNQTIKKQYEIGEVITKVRLALAYGPNGEEFCSWDYNPPVVKIPVIQLQGNCNDNGDIVIYQIPAIINGIKILGITKHPDNTGTFTILNKATTLGYHEIRMTPGHVGKVIVEFGNTGSSCTLDLDIPAKDCCIDISQKIKVSTSTSSGKHFFNITGAPPNATTTINNTKIYGNGSVELVTGTYTYTIEVPGCPTITGRININNQEFLINLSPKTQNLCAGQPSQVVKLSAGLAPGAQVKYRKNSGPIQTVTLDSNGNYSFPTVNNTTTYEVVELIYNGIGQTFSEVATINFVSNPSASISGNKTIYQGDIANLLITGTGGSKVTLSDGSTFTLPEGVGNVTLEVPVSPLNTTTYTISKVELGDCQGSKSGSAIITVNPPIIINESHGPCDPSGKVTMNFSSSVSGGTWRIFADAGKTILLSSTNSVTVNPNQLQDVFVEYTPTTGLRIDKQFNVPPCNCPEINFNISASPSVLCGPDTTVVTVSNVTGATDPVYNFMWDGNETGYQASNTRAINISNSTVVTVTVKDNAMDSCISSPQSISISVGSLPTPFVSSSDPNVTQLDDTNFEVCENSGPVIFSADQNYWSIQWSILGYSGALPNTNSRNVTVDPSLITGPSASLTLQVSTLDGCQSTITVNITKKPCSLLGPNDVLFTTYDKELVKVTINSSGLSNETLTCSNIATNSDLTIAGNRIYAFQGGQNATEPFYVLDMNACTRVPIPGSGANKGSIIKNETLAAISNNEIVYTVVKGGGASFFTELYIYNISTNTHSSVVATFNTVSTQGLSDAVKLGNKLYIVVFEGTDANLYSFDIGVGTLTNKTLVGTLPVDATSEGLVTIDGDLYTLSSRSSIPGQVHKINLSNPSASTVIGTLAHTNVTGATNMQ